MHFCFRRWFPTPTPQKRGCCANLTLKCWANETYRRSSIYVYHELAKKTGSQCYHVSRPCTCLNTTASLCALLQARLHAVVRTRPSLSSSFFSFAPMESQQQQHHTRHPQKASSEPPLPSRCPDPSSLSSTSLYPRVSRPNPRTGIVETRPQ